MKRHAVTLAAAAIMAAAPIAVASAATMASAAVTPSSENHACDTVARYHNHHASASATLRAAQGADRELRGFIVRFVRTGKGYADAWQACNADA
jgi:hypothetical protein